MFKSSRHMPSRLRKKGTLCAMAIFLSFGTVATASADDDSDEGWKANPFVKLVRQATRQFQDPEVAMAAGYIPDPFCVSGPEVGATGVHFLNPALIDDVMVAEEPELLVYEPQKNGKLKLVAVEYIAFTEDPLVLEGHLTNRTGVPNRFGIPFPFRRLHVWAWKKNPNGFLADYNPKASCDAYKP